MKASIFLSVIAVIIHFCDGSLPRPRGVSISMAGAYQPNSENTFKCLDGSMTVPFEHINDDYCDCPDGSDEPGTAACPQMRFHCTNAGYLPSNIRSSRVNDGVCDCCDGTDEYDNIIQCQNNCIELGRALREEREKVRKLQEEGFQKRKQFSEEGKKNKEEKRVKLQELETQKIEAETQKKELEAKKNEAEEPEKKAKEKHEKAWEETKTKLEAEREAKKAQDAFENLDTNKDNLVQLDEMKTHKEFDIDSNGEVGDEEAKEYLEENESVDLDHFTEKVWPNIKQIYKKEQPVVESAEPAESKGDEQPAEESSPQPPSVGDGEAPPHTDPHDVPPPSPDEGHDDGEEGDYDDEDDEDDSVDDHEHDHDVDHTEADQELKMPDYDEETNKLIEVANEARRQYDEADQKFKNIEKEISALNNYLAMDFGPEDEYSVLKDNCYEYTDREYTYKFCPFDRASQRPKNGGAETSLGSWGHWSGPENDRYESQKLERGQNCWNGPDRSVKVLHALNI
ncbi:hypothetical protein KUTeg_016346 [Tegillarca granosa]|uniref:Glucosidase 2 subunit beta n=1 Tax=Tegillarca granosa TaxID=220873 RepID=A0ABQ9EPF1_TEGGR|nr:hypothetical protein KUTeg_016346 [Tegillarca granosa]